MKLEAVVAFRRLGEVGEPARLRPVELACETVVSLKSRREEQTAGRTRVDDHASDRCAVTANPLRCAMNDNVGTVFDRADEVTACTKGVVDDEGDAVRVSYLGKLGNGSHVVFRVPD